jgi:hypothetical protein
MNDKRKVLRVKNDSSYVIKIKDKVLSGRVVDISYNGVSCVVDETLVVNSKVLFKLNLNGEVINIMCRVSRIENISPGRIKAVLLFQKTDREILDKIKLFIKEKMT